MLDNNKLLRYESSGSLHDSDLSPSILSVHQLKQQATCATAFSFMQTHDQYREVIQACKDIFEKKTRDYGTAWRILRLPSITDQIYIKAKRIRSIQEKGTQKVQEDISSEFIGIINYCVMALIQADLPEDASLELPYEELSLLYDKHVDATLTLLMQKNHDYGEAWRDMRVSSMTDLILMKLLRVRKIEDNQGSTLISEGVEANYQDMINYAVFCLIKLQEARQSTLKSVDTLL